MYAFCKTGQKACGAKKLCGTSLQLTPPFTQADRNLAKWDSDLATCRIWSVSSLVGPSTSTRGRLGLPAETPDSSWDFKR